MTQAQLEKLIRDGHTPKYGFLFAPLKDAKGKPLRVNGQPVPMPGWLIEKHIYNGFRVPGYKGQAWHFMRFVDELWGDKSDKDGLFEWNPNAVRMLEGMLEHKRLALAGNASSGKTNFVALAANALYLLNPDNTKCLVTSMTIKTAESKVWGWVEAYWNRALRKIGVNNMPGVLTSSDHIIRRKTRDGKLSRLHGIELVPADKSEYKKSATKLQGFKAGGGDLWLLADELDTLSPNLLNTAQENLFANDGFHMIGAFNPTSHFTPGGIFATPKHGWKSIDIDTHEWETVHGYCLRFDGLRSPNVLEGKPVWLGLLSLEALNGFRERFQGNENSPGFVSMVRGFFSSSGSDETVLSEAEIENYDANRRTSTWMDRGVMVAGLDPAFCHDGDLAVLTIGRVGMAMDNDLGIQKKVCERIKTYVLDSDVKASKDKSEQVVEQVKNKLIEHNVATEDLAVDISGAASFGSLLARDIGAGFLHVNFGGSPSETRVSLSDKRTGREAYVNKATELWMSLKPLVRSGQIKGLDPDTIVELTTRTCKATASGRSEIESKKKMKQRTNGESPDKSDSLVLMAEVARQKHGLVAIEKPARPPKKPSQVGNSIFHQVYDMGEEPKHKTRIKVPDMSWQEDSWQGIGSGGWDE